MSLENKIGKKSSKTEKVKEKKNKEYTLGMLMKRWYENIKDPFDSIIYGTKCAIYATHAVPTLKRQINDRYEKYRKPMEEVNNKLTDIYRIIGTLEDKYKETKDESLKEKIKTNVKEIRKLENEREKICKKQQPGSGWSILSSIVTTGAMGGAYTIATGLAVGASGPVGYAVLGVPVVTQLGSHIKESYIKAKRDLKKEAEERKKNKDCAVVV